MSNNKNNRYTIVIYFYYEHNIYFNQLFKIVYGY